MPKPRLGTATYMQRIMLGWLASAGYYRCSICQIWKKKHRTGYCADCQAAYERAKYIPVKLARKPPASDLGSRAYRPARIVNGYYQNPLHQAHLEALWRVR